MRLLVTEVSDCEHIELTVTKPDGTSSLGAGTYILRVGTCAVYGQERGRVTDFPGGREIVFRDIPYLGNEGDLKEFCVTKEAGGNEAWWWSNFATVTSEEVCE